MLKFFRLTNTIVILAIFVAILLVTFVSLESLSPVGYEDYLAYKNAQNNDSVYANNPNSNPNAQVAGISTEASPSLEFTNLLEGKKINYQLNSESGKMTLEFTLTAADVTHPLSRFPLVYLRNPTNEVMDVYLNISPNDITLESSDFNFSPSASSNLNFVALDKGKAGMIDATNLKAGNYKLSIFYYNTSVSDSPELDQLP